MTKEDLAPCPNCGSDDLEVCGSRRTEYYVCCNDCGTEGPSRIASDDAKESWNDGGWRSEFDILPALKG